MAKLPIFEEDKTLRIEYKNDTIDDIPEQWRNRVSFFGRMRRITIDDEDIDVRLIEDKETQLWGFIMTDAKHRGKVLIDIEFGTDFEAERAFDEFAEGLISTKGLDI